MSKKFEISLPCFITVQKGLFGYESYKEAEHEAKTLAALGLLQFAWKVKSVKHHIVKTSFLLRDCV